MGKQFGGVVGAAPVRFEMFIRLGDQTEEVSGKIRGLGKIRERGKIRGLGKIRGRGKNIQGTSRFK